MASVKVSNISITGNEKIGLISNLSTMLAAGIPILETVDSILEDVKGNQRKLLQALRDDLIEGKRISATFAKFPNIFDKVTVNIIKAAEEAGNLDVALKDLKENIKREMEFGDKVRSAFIYPGLIFIVFSGVILLILVFVVPRIATVFSRLNVALPLPTRVLIFISNALLTYTIPIILITIVTIISSVMLYKAKRRQFLQMILSLPLISDLGQLIDLTHFTRSMFLLLTSGIPITTALELAQETILNKRVEKAISQSRNMILSGKRLSEGLKANKKCIPSIMIKIVEAGEKSGTLDRSMSDITEFLDYQVTNTLKMLTTLMEPLILIFAGGLIGGMMLSIIAPIYSIISQVGS
ncbi:MAG: type II secretion system F family protein [Candidatus Roizmanbacteria bacterium]